jgi:PKD repeat protein
MVRISHHVLFARLARCAGLALALTILWAGAASALTNGQPCPPYWSEGTHPSASFTVSPANTESPNVVIQFDASASTSGTAFAWTYNSADAACEESLTASSDPIASYRWNWGDGTTDTDASAVTSHVYAAAGIYAVTLTVQEENAHALGTTTTYFTSTTSQQVTIVNPPPVASFTASMSTGQVAVVDASQSSDQDGTITNYHWDWGDGQTSDTTSPTSSHSYATGGIKTITLTVTDSFGNTGQAQVTIDVPGSPAASFTAPATATTGQPAQFDASGSSAPVGSIVSYTWDFGDGQTQTTSTPTIDHTYAAAGANIVTLTVTDSSGDTADAQRILNVLASSGTVGTTGSSTASSSGGTTGTTGGNTSSLKCVVPKLHGDKLAQARTALAANHCTLGTVKHGHAPKREENRVIAQSTKPGKTLGEGTAIRVTVGEKKNTKGATI